MSTSTTTSTKNTPDISPKDFIQLNEYRDFHRQRQNSLSSNHSHVSSYYSISYGNGNGNQGNQGQGSDGNDTNKDSHHEHTEEQVSDEIMMEEFDPFLKKYIRNKKFLTFDKTGSKKFFLNGSNKPIRPHRLLAHRKRNQLLSTNDKASSASSTKSLSPTQYQQTPAVTNQVPRQVQDDNQLMSLKLPTSRLSETSITHVPRNFIDCGTDDLIILISRMLKNLINLNNKNVPESIKNSGLPQKDKNPLLTRYHSRTPPNISIINYLSRLTKFNNLSSANLLTTIYYIDLLSYNYQPFFTLNSWTVHRFLLVATMISQKSMEDYFFTNEHYAKVGGIAVTELNFLEIDFLTRVNWKCVPFKLENGKSSIRESKSILDLYYNQLIELMGTNCNDEESVYAFEGDFGYHSDDDDDLEDGSGDVMKTSLEGLEKDPQYTIDHSKFNDDGYSVDATSSPHLKRRYTNL